MVKPERQSRDGFLSNFYKGQQADMFRVDPTGVFHQQATPAQQDCEKCRSSKYFVFLVPEWYPWFYSLWISGKFLINLGSPAWPGGAMISSHHRKLRLCRHLDINRLFADTSDPSNSSAPLCAFVLSFYFFPSGWGSLSHSRTTHLPERSRWLKCLAVPLLQFGNGPAAAWLSVL